MQKRHADKQQYFNEQAISTERYVIPFIETYRSISAGTRVLEIGCGEAGNLKPFLEMGCICTGIDYSEGKIEKAKEFYAEHLSKKNISLLVQDIYNVKDFDETFDVLIIRDVIEHIHNQERFLQFVKPFMHANSVVFIAFPPWQNPFGGHQQICRGKILSMFPYIHLLPKSIYKSLLKVAGESDATIESLLEIKETGISTERFEKIVSRTNYKILKEQYFLVNPTYEVKFGLHPRKLLGIFRSIRYFRNFVTTGVYFLIQKK